MKGILKFLAWLGVAVGAYIFLGIFTILFFGISVGDFFAALLRSFVSVIVLGLVCISIREFRARRISIEIASISLNNGGPRLKYACISCKEQYVGNGFCSNPECRDFAEKLRRISYDLVEQE